MPTCCLAESVERIPVDDVTDWDSLPLVRGGFELEGFRSQPGGFWRSREKPLFLPAPRSTKTILQGVCVVFNMHAAPGSSSGSFSLAADSK